MTFTFLILLAFLGAIANRARGSNYGALISSDMISRFLSMGSIAAMNIIYFAPATIFAIWELFLGSLLLLWLWCMPGWDKYWSAAIGHGLNHSRLWGAGMLTLRMALILPYYAFLIYFINAPLFCGLYAASFLLMGFTYYISGYLTPDKNVIRNAEWVNGAIIGATTWAIGA